jgi:hypothetical protein
MNTRSLTARLKRLEFRLAPGYQRPQIEIHIVDSKAQTLFKMRLGAPENHYFTPGGLPISKDEAHRLSLASKTEDLP